MLGDSGYGARSWLLTPVINNVPLTNGARRYLRRLKITRQLIECSLGVLKEEFPCLNHLRLRTPEACAKVILTCITLHNIQNEFRHNQHAIDINLGMCTIYLNDFCNSFHSIHIYVFTYL